MKASSLHTLKRFLFLLITNKDIVEQGNHLPPSKRTQNTSIRPDREESILFHTPEKNITIQPEEIGELEHIDIFPDGDETGALSEAEDYSPHALFREVLEDSPEPEKEAFSEPKDSYEAISPENFSQKNEEKQEDIFYDYAMSDIPASVLEEEAPKEEPVRKNKKLMSLRDVLVERGNFWEDNNKKSKNIWERDTEMPEEEMIINDSTLVGDVMLPKKGGNEELETI